MLCAAALLLLVAMGQSTRLAPVDSSAMKHTSPAQSTQNRTQVDVKHVRRKLGRIVGGSDASPREFPHQVAWLLNGQFMCGASILSQEWILSAAHCFPNGNDTQGSSFRVGSLYSTQGGSLHSPVAFHQHPGWTSEVMDWDLGLIKVDPPIQLSESAKAIRMVPEQQVLQDGDLLTVTGWGLTAAEHAEKHAYGGSWTLQKVNLHFVKHSECVDHYKTYAVTERMLCAQAPHKDACQGDSGGPLVSYAENDTARLVGLVSWGSGCASPKYPGVFTDLRNPGVRHYIEAVTGLSLSSSKAPASTTTPLPPQNKDAAENRSRAALGGASVNEWVQTLLRGSAANVIDQSLALLPEGLQLPDNIVRLGVSKN